MLEHVPASIGHALQGRRAGMEKLATHREAASVPASITVSSPAFQDGGVIPARYTADGPGVSPPLAWSGVPEGAAGLLLLVQDADSPSADPLVHAIVVDLPTRDGSLTEGELPSPAGDGTGHEMGRNSFLRRQWLRPDPPTGHGPHVYAFQLFALSRDAAEASGKRSTLELIRDFAIAKGVLTGTYERPDR